MDGVIGSRRISTGDELSPSCCCGVGLGLTLWISVKNSIDSLACDSVKEIDRDSINSAIRTSFPSAISDLQPQLHLLQGLASLFAIKMASRYCFW